MPSPIVALLSFVTKGLEQKAENLTSQIYSWLSFSPAREFKPYADWNPLQYIFLFVECTVGHKSDDPCFH